MSRLWLALVFFGIALLARTSAVAFPDLIRHGYVNCNACHVSPTGGGMMSDYGRALSKELLSASSGEREAEFLHGLLPEDALNSWLRVGGDLRILQLHREDPNRKVGRTIPMQANFDVAAITEKFSAVFSIGQLDQATRGIRPVAPKYYVMWNARDELSIRAGKFMPAFGLNVPYHTLPTRQGLSFGVGQEREAIESVWNGETWNFAGSVSRSARELPKDQREELFTAQLNRTLGTSHRIGASLAQGRTDSTSREAASLHAALGFTEHLAYLTEFTWQTTSGTTKTTGLYHFSQLLWEARKGWNLYLMEDYQLGDLSDTGTLADGHGAGLRYFPRPHIEIDFAWFKRRKAVVADRYDDEAWLLLHYYF
jgi:hypothetical protein